MSQLQTDILKVINKAIEDEELKRMVATSHDIPRYSYSTLTLLALKERLVQSGLLYVTGADKQLADEIAYSGGIND